MAIELEEIVERGKEIITHVKVCDILLLFEKLMQICLKV